MSLEESESLPQEEALGQAEDEEEQVLVQEEGEYEEVAEEELGEGDVDALVAASSALYDSTKINDQVFENLVLEGGVVVQVQEAWANFLKAAQSKEAAGEAIFKQVFEYAPAMKSMFKTPIAVLAMRFMNALSDVIGALNDPKSLRVHVETLGFQHLEVNVSAANVNIFRDAIADLVRSELGAARFTEPASIGLRTTLNYVGGALIFVRVKYADRLRILSSSWATANSRVDELTGTIDAHHDENHEGKGEGEEGEEAPDREAGNDLLGKGKGDAAGERQQEGATNTANNTAVPQSFNDMFLFNAAVMGFGQNTWMHEVLERFDNIVSNVSNSSRMQEECELLSLTLDRYTGTLNLFEFKAVMLASLRSLVPKDWNSAHEVAWTWLWENIERLLNRELGKPRIHEEAMGRLFGGLDEATLSVIKRDLYANFFVLAPGGMDVFKQSKTRLNFVADKALGFTAKMYQDPKGTVRELSALGLKHVGWGIPTELFPPFVTANVHVMKEWAPEDIMVEAFKWSLSLVSRILMRVITEGSTIVMKAINVNSARMLKKAIGCAPRNKRAMWMLNVQVGTEKISPLVWAVETGAVDTAREMIIDLLTIRADRDAYYYGMDAMFNRHPDIIRILGIESPELLPLLLDGLIWRARSAENGVRRVNYYVKYLLMDTEGNFSPTIEWVTDMKDPKVVCHPCLALVTDTVWTRVAFRSFLLQKLWFLLTLVIFTVSQSVLKKVADDENRSGEVSLVLRVVIMVCRVFIYSLSLGQWIFFHSGNTLSDLRNGDLTSFGPVRVPSYLVSWQSVTSLLLMVFLLLMFATEPLLHCMSHEPIFTTHCPEGVDIIRAYSVFSFGAMLMYFLLLLDLSVISTRISAFVLVCARVLPEVFQFFGAVVFFSLTFSAGVSCLQQYNEDFAGLPLSFVQLIKITVGMFRGSHWEDLHEYPLLLIYVMLYVLVSLVFLANVLIAQLSCLYQVTYEDMVGYARLNRGKVVVSTMLQVPGRRWREFTNSLKLDERCEFGEGDIGLPGAIQVLELASANRTNLEMIKRFGGSTDPSVQWPEDAVTDNADDRVERMEKMMEKALQRMTSIRGGSGKHTSSANDSSNIESMSGSGVSGGENE